MPRKQNGFGNPKSFGFKKIGGADKGYKSGAAGRFPSDRRFGSSVQRTVIEQYDLDSDWVRWRKGFEYYSQAAWYRLEDYNAEANTYDVVSSALRAARGNEYFRLDRVVEKLASFEDDMHTEAGRVVYSKIAR